MDQCEVEFSTYRALQKEQTDIITSGKDIRALEDAIPKFSNLQKVRLFVGNFRNGGPLLKNTIARLLHSSSEADLHQASVCSVRQFMKLMDILARHKIKLSVLKLELLTYAALDQDEEVLNPVREVFASLENIGFHLSGTDDGLLPTSNRTSRYASYRAPSVISNGRAVQLLSSATPLKNLSISTDEYLYEIRARFRDFVGDCIWPRLTRLSMGSIRVAEDDLINFLCRHSTLKELSIHSLTLTGSWLTVLPKIRETASLERVNAYGYLKNDGPEYWYLGRHPDKKMVGRADESHLGLLVAYYLTTAPDEFACPLTLDNMPFW
ncbi:hypothetical protein FQN53_000379 [Emmonsiellopsis sp. PD_33]|nr:hypothetical protein FQN53_000379 [Emmonsiellopsis sp. PD_33]